MKKWEKQWREGVASGKALSSGCAPGGVWLRSPRLGLWSPASLPSYAWTWCSIQVPRKLPRPGSSLWSPLRVCSSTQCPGASPKCVPWQKLITWLKAACPGSTHYPRHTHSLGTTTLYALAGLTTTDSGGLWQGIEERRAGGMSSAWWGPGRDSEQRFESGVVGTQFFQKNAAQQGTTDYGWSK